MRPQCGSLMSEKYDECISFFIEHLHHQFFLLTIFIHEFIGTLLHFWSLTATCKPVEWCQIISRIM